MDTLKHFEKGSDMPNIPADGLVVLYSMRFCPYAERAQLVLDAKEIPHHKIYINLVNKPDWFISKSESGKVPALELLNEPGAPVINESMIIADYLDEKFTENRFLYGEPMQKAKDKMLIEKFTPIIASVHELIVKGCDGPDMVPWKLMIARMELYETEIKRRNTPFFGGNIPGMLDYMIWPWFERISMFQHLFGNNFILDKSYFTGLAKWIEAMLEDPAVKKSFLDGITHSDFVRSRYTGLPNYHLLSDETLKYLT